MFFDAVDAALSAGEKLEGTRYDELVEQMKDFEYDWWANRPGTFSATPQGNPVELVRHILESQ